MRASSVCGIYAIRNTLTQHQYIGSSADINSRFQRHRSLLRSGRHHSEHLQRAWNKYGEDAFTLVIIEQCNQASLRIREQHYLDTVKPEYNVCVDAIAPSAGRTLSDEHKRKIGISNAVALKGRKLAPRPPEVVAKISRSLTGKRYPLRVPARKGMKLSEDEIAKRTETRRINHAKKMEARQQWINEHPGETPSKMYTRTLSLVSRTRRATKVKATWEKKQADREQWIVDHPDDPPPRLRTVSPESLARNSDAQKAAWAAKWEERRKWIEDHPGQTPPKMRKSHSPESIAKETAKMREYNANRKRNNVTE